MEVGATVIVVSVETGASVNAGSEVFRAEVGSELSVGAAVGVATGVTSEVAAGGVAGTTVGVGMVVVVGVGTAVGVSVGRSVITAVGVSLGGTGVGSPIWRTIAFPAPCSPMSRTVSGKYMISTPVSTKALGPIVLTGIPAILEGTVTTVSLPK